MIGLILFLIFVVIVAILFKLAADQFGLDPKIRMIVGLLVLMFVILWMFGSGGYHTVYGWHP